MGLKNLKCAVLLCFLTFTVSCGQQKRYIEYTTKEGEDIATIAKKLNVSADDLLRLNPDIGNSPKANSVIIIPNTRTGVEKEISKNSELKSEEKDPLIKGNTSSGLPDKANQAKRLLDALKKEFVIHQVKKGDTFYSLTRFYNVTENSLKDLNPELIEGLKVGQVIKIKKIDTSNKLAVNASAFYIDNIQPNSVLDVAILLPFKANDLSDLDGETIFKNSKLATLVTDFYLGAEFAIDSLRAQGVTINTEVIDTGKKGSKIEGIINTVNLDAKDLIIGPLYSDELSLLAAKTETPVVLPVYSKKQHQLKAKNIITTVPNKALYLEKITNYIQDSVSNANIIIVTDANATLSNKIIRLERRFKSLDSIKGVSKVYPEKGFLSKQKFQTLLNPLEENIVFIASSNTITAASTINALIGLPENIKLKVFTDNDISLFKDIDNMKLAKVGLTFVTDKASKLDLETTALFYNLFEAKNGSVPSEYALKGFDITYDFLIRLASNKPLDETFKEGVSYRTQTKFNFLDNSKPITNKGLSVVRYNLDLTTSVLN